MPRNAPPLSASAIAEMPSPRTRNSRSGTSGSFARASTSTNAPIRMTAAPNSPSTSAEPQPTASVRMTPPTSANRPGGAEHGAGDVEARARLRRGGSR